MSDYSLKLVTNSTDKWHDKDPVRPELSADFRKKPGRQVYGLLDEDGEFRAFLCLAHTISVPSSVKELDRFTSEFGRVVVPYSVWSYKKGAGREIVNLLIAMAKEDEAVDRVVTLSPKTDMARNFHLKNGAVEVSWNYHTVNYEYSLTVES